MQPVTLTEARAQLGAANFDWGLIGPVVNKMVEYTVQLNTWAEHCGPQIPPILGREQLREAVGFVIGDFVAIGNHAGFVTWRAVMNRVRGRLIFHGVMQQGNAGQRNRLLWAFYLLFRTVRTQGDIGTLGVTAAVTFVDALYGLD